jgi:hypothetical protein
MIWNVPKIWEEGDVWILGGGPSVPKQFGIPQLVVQQVVNGTSPPSVYSPYMSGIHDKHVIGINVAYLIGDWIDVAFFGDIGFFLQHKEKLAQFPGIKVCCHPQIEKFNWVKYLPRDHKGRGISDNPNSVSWNYNSGAAAISLAIHAGAKRVILLGFDMKLDTTNMQHWHNLYGRGQVMDAKRIMKLPFVRHLRGFPEIAKDAKRMGVEVLNGSPDSAIVDFPKYSVNDLLIKTA